ncbi:TPA: hypothetical protein LLT22_001535 [Enterobacter asburiae]|nr:hypothetical protein [Enterobacter asburiae]
MKSDKSFRADGGDIGTDRIEEIANNPYGDEEKCWLAQQVLHLKKALKGSEHKNTALAAELSDLKHPGTYLPSKRETPALDAFLADLQAKGVEKFAELPAVKMVCLSHLATWFAEKLRQEAAK